MIESLNDPKLAELVLRDIRMLVDNKLPDHGVVAGQAVASLIDRYTNKGISPINDIDLFLPVSIALNQSDKDVRFCKLGTRQVDIQNLFDYTNLGSLGLSELSSYNISSVTRTGMLNSVYFTSNTIFTEQLPTGGARLLDRLVLPQARIQRIIGAFDINCTQVGIDLHSGLMAYTPAYAYFWQTRELEVISAHTPMQTALRILGKAKDIEQAYLNEELQLKALAKVLLNLDWVTKDLKLSLDLAATAYMGSKFKDKFDQLKTSGSYIAQFFDIEDVQGKNGKDYFKAVSKVEDDNKLAQRSFRTFWSCLERTHEFYSKEKAREASRFLASAYLKIDKFEKRTLPKKVLSFGSKIIKNAKKLEVSYCSSLEKHEDFFNKVIENNNEFNLEHGGSDCLSEELLKNSLVEEMPLSIYLFDGAIRELDLDPISEVNILMQLINHGDLCFNKDFNPIEYKKAYDFLTKEHALGYFFNPKEKSPKQLIEIYRELKRIEMDDQSFIGALESQAFNKHRPLGPFAGIQEAKALVERVRAREKALSIKREKLYKKVELDSVLELVTAEDLRNEGSDMHHCVGGYSLRVLRGKSRIFSIGSESRNNRATLQLDMLSVGGLMTANSLKLFTKDQQKTLKSLMVGEPRQLKGFANKAPTHACIQIALKVLEHVNKESLEKAKALTVDTAYDWRLLEEQLLSGSDCQDFLKNRNRLNSNHPLVQPDPPARQIIEDQENQENHEDHEDHEDQDNVMDDFGIPF